MIVKHILIGGVFTFVGLVSLLSPYSPVLCIGALIWGPIELMYGFIGKEAMNRPRRNTQAVQAAAGEWLCPACGMRNGSLMAECVNCGTYRA